MKPPVSHRLAALLLLGACGGQSAEFAAEGERDAVRPAPAGDRQAPPRGPVPVIDLDTSITLERTTCYGGCPTYSLSISGDGSVRYIGTHWVKVIGEASSQVAVSEVQALVDEMWTDGYLDMNEPSPCSETYTDAPSAITSLTLGSQTHRVDHYRGNSCAPAALTTIENRIDEVAGSERWVRCEPPSASCPLDP